MLSRRPDGPTAEAAVPGPLVLCVLIWPHRGRHQQLREYEDQVLGLLVDHGGEVLQRLATAAPTDGPSEVQVLRFPSEVELASFLADERRVGLAPLREVAVCRTEVMEATFLR